MQKRTVFDLINFGHGLIVDRYYVSHVGYSDPDKLYNKILFYYNQGKLIDATFGEETRSLIVLINGYAIKTDYTYERLVEMMEDVKDYCPYYERM